MQTNDLPIVVLGTVSWAIAFVVLLVRSDFLADDVLARWTWACVAGLFLGAIGIRHLRRKARTLRDRGGRPPRSVSGI